MTYHSNLVGELIEYYPELAAERLRELIDRTNGNGREVAVLLGVTERQVGRWMRRLRDQGVADLRAYRQAVRAGVKGAIHVDATGRRGA